MVVNAVHHIDVLALKTSMENDANSRFDEFLTNDHVIYVHTFPQICSKIAPLPKFSSSVCSDS